MTRLPESGQLGTNTVRDHFGGSGQTSWPSDYYRGQLVPDVQQFTGSGSVSNDTGSRDQHLRLFIHDGFFAGNPPGFYTIQFNTGSTGPLLTSVDGAPSPDADATDFIGEIQEDIAAVYPSFEFSRISHHTAQASSVETVSYTHLTLPTTPYV